MADAITIYVYIEDGTDAPYTVNTEYEMEEQYVEMLNDVYGTVTIAGMDYDTAQTLKDVDPIAYRVGLSDYVSGMSGEWEEMTIPWDVYYGDDDARDEWIAANLTN